MAEERLRLVSLTVLGGALHGRRYDPDEVVTEILIGADTDCHLVVDQPGVSPIHARVWADLDQSTVHDTHAPRGLYVNATRVEGEAPIGEGDVLWLGPPQEADSACIQCHFEPWVEVLPATPLEGVSPEPGADESAPAGLETAGHQPSGAESSETEPTEAEPSGPATGGSVPIEAYEQVLLEEEVSAPEPEPAEPEPVAEPPAPGPLEEDDPFFVGEGQGTLVLPPPRPAPAVEEPFVENETGPSDVLPVEEVSFEEEEAEPPPSPEALVAETVADDWQIREGESPAPLEASPEVPGPADEFFFAEGPAEPEVGGLPLGAEPVPAPSAPALDLPPLEPLPEPPLLRAPLPPTLAPAPAVAEPVPAPEPVPELEPAEPVRELESEPEPEPALAPALAPEPEPAPTPAPVRVPESVLPLEPAAPASVTGGAPRPRPEPTSARRPPPGPSPRPAAARRPGLSARPARRASRSFPGWLRPVGLGAGLALLVAIAFGALRLFGGGVRLNGIEPARVRMGQRAALTGSGFGPATGDNTVLFGDREARVLLASPTRLEVEVPEVAGEAGVDKRVGVVVRTAGRSSAVLEATVFQGPRLHGISPEAAMPGEEVLLQGTGWGPGATVRFGDIPARLSELAATRIRAIVPEGVGRPGAPAPVVVAVGGVDSNPAPFVVGHLPVVSAVAPATAAAGDVVEVSGRGFHGDPLRDDVRVAGVPALVLSAASDALKVVVPRVGPGDAARVLEVRVPGSENVGQAVLQVAAPADPVEFRFVAEPFPAVPGRPHAVLATGLGPAFVVAASGGRTAAARAVEAAARLNAVAQPLRTTMGLNLEARGLDSTPVIGLPGSPDVLLEVTEQDAAAYAGEESGSGSRGGAVTRARLARWWEAVGRDLVLLTIRGERPRFAAALAPEGRALGQIFDAARRTGRPGVPLQVLDEARPALREGLRLLALRVPASVAAPAVAATVTPASVATPPPGRLVLEGTWTGSQVEEGQRQYLTVAFRRGGGTISYEGGITLTLPLLNLEQDRRDQVRFSVEIRGGIRHYSAAWNGAKLVGTVSRDVAGRNVVATFELRRQ